MKVLIYKRTHKGDPDTNGIFGNQDCMGRIRNWDFDAVIGIGGKSPWKEDIDIKYKINWIGLGPKKVESDKRGPAVVFENFALFEEKGKDIQHNYPHLFSYMYQSRKRFDMSAVLPQNVLEEVMQILESAKRFAESPEYYTEDIDRHMTASHSEIQKCSGSCNGRNLEIEIDSDHLSI